MLTAAEREAHRERLLAWLRSHGVATTGKALAAAVDGERDLATLYRLNMADGVSVKENPDGERLPASLRDGDSLAVPVEGTVVGDPMRDPETGAYWITLRTATDRTDRDYAADSRATLVDRELAPGEPVQVRKRKRTLPPYLQPAHDQYLCDRAAWEAAREAASIGYETERREWVAENPPPNWRLYVKEAAALHNAQKGEDPTRYQDEDDATAA